MAVYVEVINIDVSLGVGRDVCDEVCERVELEVGVKVVFINFI